MSNNGKETPINGINRIINNLAKEKEIRTDDVSDGYHTFGELYRHRIALYIALCRQFVKNSAYRVWRSKMHSDGDGWDGWFIMGVVLPNGKQISYHLNISYWDKAEFCETLERGLVWDGHTSDKVIELLLESQD